MCNATCAENKTKFHKALTINPNLKDKARQLNVNAEHQILQGHSVHTDVPYAQGFADDGQQADTAAHFASGKAPCALCSMTCVSTIARCTWLIHPS